MFNRQNDEILYFSTKVELKINGTVYRPSICYKVPTLAKKSLEKFVAEGKVSLYTSPVRFVNGIVKFIPVNQATEGASSIVREDAPEKQTRKKGK
jgi:hypothetical protein